MDSATKESNQTKNKTSKKGKRSYCLKAILLLNKKTYKKNP